MKVKITGNNNGDAWYGEYMGKTFEVVESFQYDNDDHRVVGESKKSLLAVDTDGATEYYVRRIDCEVMSKPCEEVKEMTKFNIGDTVKITQEHHSNGRVGIITESRDSQRYPWRVSFDGVPCDIFGDADMELVEPQWMSKETALKLCIDGAKIVNEFHIGAWYICWNGKEFMSTNGNTLQSAAYVFDGADEKSWKLWTPPKPKFAVNDFVIDKSDNAYMRVTAVKEYDKEWNYECTSYSDESGDVFFGESELTAV